MDLVFCSISSTVPNRNGPQFYKCLFHGYSRFLQMCWLVFCGVQFFIMWPQGIKFLKPVTYGIFCRFHDQRMIRKFGIELFYNLLMEDQLTLFLHRWINTCITIVIRSILSIFFYSIQQNELQSAPSWDTNI